MAKHNNFLSVVAACDDFPYGLTTNEYYQLYLPNDDVPHGYMLPEIVERMPWTSCFVVQHKSPRWVKVVDRSNGVSTAAAVNTAFQELVDICIQKDLFQVLSARHSERFAVVGARYDAPVYIERFAISLLGLTTRGAHLVAYSYPRDEDMRIWVSRRSPHLFTYPGMLDVTVAGGVKSGVTPLQTIVEEAQEEASLAERLIRQHVRSRGALTHMGVTGRGFSGEQGLVVPDYMFVYDIELPSDVTPKPHDDEVSEFYSMGVLEVSRALLEGRFKPDAGAVMVEFLMRHSFLTPENEKDFVEITMRLHRRLPFRVT